MGRREWQSFSVSTPFRIVRRSGTIHQGFTISCHGFTDAQVFIGIEEFGACDLEFLVRFFSRICLVAFRSQIDGWIVKFGTNAFGALRAEGSEIIRDKLLKVFKMPILQVLVVFEKVNILGKRDEIVGSITCLAYKLSDKFRITLMRSKMNGQRISQA
ncbi:hypothetical protein [Govanella unica]|uniref:Uncharacterized protein n=1 Tax=Govanella unica TaxID=2975056 RepID=A0A9X3TVG2_9PROT|nr:hypothetical protein [Govania unica]MDA5192755.1 hypothetical protein [Govania unica]